MSSCYVSPCLLFLLPVLSRPCRDFPFIEDWEFFQLENINQPPEKMVMGRKIQSLSLSHVLVAMLAFSHLAVALAAQKHLRFGPNGKFKILQVADMHFGDGKVTPCLNVLPTQMHTCSDVNTTVFIDRMIRAEKPDLIVFTGTLLLLLHLLNFVS